MFNEIRDRHIQPPTTLLNHLLLLPSAPPTSNSICPYIQPSTKLIHIINILNVLNNSFIQFIVIDFFCFFFSFYILLILVSFKKYQKIKKILKSKNNCVLKTCPSPRKHIRSTATVLTNCRWQLCRWFIRCLADLKIKKKKKKKKLRVKISISKDTWYFQFQWFEFINLLKILFSLLLLHFRNIKFKSSNQLKNLIEGQQEH